MPRHPLAHLALCALLLPAGCDLLRADIEVKTVCATLPDYAMPGAPASGTFSTDLSYDLGSDLTVLTDSGYTSTLTLTSLELSVGSDSGATDLSQVESLDATVLAPNGSALPPLDAAQYSRGASASETTLFATSLSSANLVPYLQGGTVNLSLQAQGALPVDPWTATVTACFLLEVNMNYGKKL